MNNSIELSRGDVKNCVIHPLDGSHPFAWESEEVKDKNNSRPAAVMHVTCFWYPLCTNKRRTAKSSLSRRINNTVSNTTVRPCYMRVLEIFSNWEPGQSRWRIAGSCFFALCNKGVSHLDWNIHEFIFDFFFNNTVSNININNNISWTRQTLTCQSILL